MQPPSDTPAAVFKSDLQPVITVPVDAETVATNYTWETHHTKIPHPSGLCIDKLPLYMMPPYTDCKYGSRCYPLYTETRSLTQNFSSSIVHQMSEINLNRLRWEETAFCDLKAPIYQVHRAAHGSGNYYSICSEVLSDRGRLGIFKHRRSSTMYQRIHSLPDQWGQSNCRSCKRWHPVKTGIRYRLVLSSSMLNGWRTGDNGDEYCDPFHVVYDCISGRIRTLMHSFKSQFLNSHRPLDVLAVLGINDLLEGSTVYSIMESFSRLHTIVVATATGCTSGPSTFASIATVICPPHAHSLHS